MIQKFTTFTNTILNAVERNASRWFFIFLCVITVARIGLLFISDVNLGPDETQYWYWSLTPEFGYFSKPPIIAWVIGMTTNLFGHSEWAVRLSAPLFHASSALFLYAVGRLLYNPASGFWIGTGWLLLPGVAFSSALITTDVPLLCFWSGAMLFLLRIITSSYTEKNIHYSDVISLGVCLGLGFLSKYAMIYFLIAIAAGPIFLPQMRKKGTITAFAISVSVMILLISPNIIWNAANDFQTVSHTAANANWQGALFKPIKLLEFWLAQFGIVGPVIITTFLLGLLFKKRFLINLPEPSSLARQQEIMLIILALTPILIVSIQAFVSRAHANWAAASYPAITVLAVAWLFQMKRPRLLVISHGLHVLLTIALFIGLSNFRVADTFGFSNAVKRVRGWETHGEVIARTAANYDAVMADDRELSGEILYYGKIATRNNQAGRSFMAWNSNNRIDDHYEAFLPFKPHLHPRLLYITTNPDAAGVHHMFEMVDLLETSTVDLKRGKKRTLYFFSLEGFRG